MCQERRGIVSFQRITKENGDICLVDQTVGTVVLREEESYIRILGFMLPETADASQSYEALVSAAETETVKQDKDLIVCDFLQEQEKLAATFAKSGFESRETDSIISVATEDLLSSAGIEKSLRMKFPGMETFSLEDLMTFQREELSEFLNRHHYAVTEDGLEKFDAALSAVTYDDQYKPRAVLLATRGEKEILVELLIGFSTKNPQYILSACQAFVNSIKNEGLKDEYKNITMLTLNASVIPLLRRLLDKEYELVTRSVVVHAEKKPEDRGSEINELEEAKNADDNSDVISRNIYQKNINEKYSWIMEKNMR